ncbi:MAG: radical SAM protein [Deltaproteobacteria bacterium]|nr:radical SAM protein [Deltaproteobacteria bacterium]
MNSSSTLKRSAQIKFTTLALSFISGSSKENLIGFTRLIEKIPQKDSYRKKIGSIRDLFEKDHPFLEIARRVLKETNAKQKEILIQFLFNQFLEGTNRRKEFAKEAGFYPPRAILISPTMRCNLNCYGCYAGDYSKEGELEGKEIDRIIDEAEEMGIHLVVVLGGEPFLRQDLFDICKRHPQTLFHVFTHGGFLNEATVEKISDLGNIAPAISLEGYEEETDRRRGKGHFQKVMKGMDLLKEAKVLFASSLTQTRENTDLLTSDGFIDFLIEKGAILTWYFMCLPVGRNPDIQWMPTPQQRDQLRQTLPRFRATKPILFVDFWNDGRMTNGCMAGGRMYCHINARGDVEPCVFCHFATDNIKGKSLLEVLDSPFFREIRSRQSNNENLLRPCMLIDRPEIAREMASRPGVYFTHAGAESFYQDLAGVMDRYTEEYGTIADPVWEEISGRNVG